MFKSAVYSGNSFLGEAEIYPQDSNPGSWIRELRISHLSPASDRCPPLAVMHTITTVGVRFKLESRGDSPLFQLYSTCLRENKTAVVPLGEEELHLVAMSSGKNIMHYSCFWGFTAAPRLYNSCLVMLNLRCLGIVFDLDETLVVANTMRSFEDKIEALQKRVDNEVDQQRITGMLSEIERYMDDKSILKQYKENDQVVDNGRVYGIQYEIVPPLSDNHQPITRPILRLQDKNIILTRVNPAIRDTSVLVRLRPAWEDLRSYLTARGRKRFEVYVCTMAEKDYALEMWRLLDPEAKLINSRELLDRIVCVKSGLRKSLLNVFQNGICHPKMALVIDDRLKVWDEKDQPRVHVVPAFAPYYAPQAEANNSTPVLCVARNVACNIRGGFFKDFDESLLPHVSNVLYEDVISFPSAPDVGNYLVTEEDTSAMNGSKDALCNENVADVEAARRLKEVNCSGQAIPPMVTNYEGRPISSLQHPMASAGVVPLLSTQVMVPFPNSQCSQPVVPCRPLGQSVLSEPSLQGSPAREEGEVPESELDPDTRRRLLILQHGQDTRGGDPSPPPPPPPPFSARPPSLQIAAPPVQSRGSWPPLEEEIIPRQVKRGPKEFPMELEPARFDRNRSPHPSFFRGGENFKFISSDRPTHEIKQLPVQVHHGDDRPRPNAAASNYRSFPGDETPMGGMPSNYSDVQSGSGRGSTRYADTSLGVLQDIAMKCGAKLEFLTSVRDLIELRFSVEAWFAGEKIGDGSGRTRKEAQYQAAERSLHNLANKYLSNGMMDPSAVQGDSNKFYNVKENGFLRDSNSFGYLESTKDDVLPFANTTEEAHLLDQKAEGPNQANATVATLKELCIMEGYNLVFQAQPSSGKDGVYAQVEIAGQILGKGAGTIWEEAKHQAAEKALETLKSMLGPFTQKCSVSPRSISGASIKRSKQDFQRTSSGRYSNNETPVP